MLLVDVVLYEGGAVIRTTRRQRAHVRHCVAIDIVTALIEDEL